MIDPWKIRWKMVISPMTMEAPKSAGSANVPLSGGLRNLPMERLEWPGPGRRSWWGFSCRRKRNKNHGKPWENEGFSRVLLIYCFILIFWSNISWIVLDCVRFRVGKRSCFRKTCGILPRRLNLVEIPIMIHSISKIFTLDPGESWDFQMFPMAVSSDKDRVWKWGLYLQLAAH